MSEPLTFGSLFAGIGGFDLGFHRSGLQCVLQVEKDGQCHSVLSRQFPEVKRLMDVQDDATIESLCELRPDGICGGFPCQDISVAGKRRGLAGERSGLWFRFRDIIAAVAPSWVCIENVAGLLSSNNGRDLGTILGQLGQLGYYCAYRVLDSQYFGVAQRRRRVFIVGCLGNAFDGRGRSLPARVLFESESMFRDSPPRREAGTDFARSITSRLGSSDPDDNGAQQRHIVSMPLKANGNARHDESHETYVTHTLRAEGHDASEDGTGRGTSIVAYRTSGNSGVMCQGDRTAALNCATDPNQQIVHQASAVRRLTPRECEQLQGFPKDWTRYGADGREISNSARYRMLGNAVTVNVAEWIGRRIVEVSTCHRRQRKGSEMGSKKPQPVEHGEWTAKSAPPPPKKTEASPELTKALKAIAGLKSPPPEKPDADRDWQAVAENRGEQIGILKDELAKVSRENASLRKDAERYRWLRNEEVPSEEFSRVCEANIIEWDCSAPIVEILSGDELDTAIDAAMTAIAEDKQ